MAVRLIPYRKSLRIVQPNFWQGVRTWLCAEPEAPLVMTGLINQLWAGIPQPYTPRCHQVDSEARPFGLANVALLTSHYRTPRIPGRCRVFIAPALRREPVEKDLDGNVVQGLDADHLNLWKQVSGPDLGLKHKCLVRIETAAKVDQYNRKAVARLYGCLNQEPCQLIGANARELLFLGVSEAFQWGQDVVELDYRFLYEPGGHVVKSQQGVWVVERVPVVEWTGTSYQRVSPTENKAMLSFKLGMKFTGTGDDMTVVAAADPVVRNALRVASFSWLPALREW